MNVLRYLRYWLRTFVWFTLGALTAVIVIGPIVVLATLGYKYWAMGVAVGEFVIAMISGVAANAYDDRMERRKADELEERQALPLRDLPPSPFPNDPRLSEGYETTDRIKPPPGPANPIVKSGDPRRVKPPMPTQFRQFPPGPDRWIRKV